MVSRMLSAALCWCILVPITIHASEVDQRVRVDSQPHSDAACSSQEVSSSRVGLNADLQDYGRVFLDSGDPACVALAAAALRSKLAGVLEGQSYVDELGRTVGPFQGWLEGAHVALIFSAALQLGGHGELDSSLDATLRKVSSSYRFSIDPECGPNFGNECIDDFAQAANGFAWIAAYEAKSLRYEAASEFALQSKEAVDEALSLRNHMCKVRHDESLPVPCGTLDRAADGLASRYLEVVSFNHGFQNVAYGLGMLPSLSGAVIGLEVAEEWWVPSEENLIVANALFLEGQRATLPDGSDFRQDCYRVVGTTLSSDSPCADAFNRLPPDDPLFDPNLFYLPRMFPVAAFFQNVFGVLPNTDPYSFDEFDAALFTNPFLNEGRLSTYGFLGYFWWNPPGSTELRPYLQGFIPPRSRPVRR